MTLINKEELLLDVLTNIKDDSQRTLFTTFIELQRPIKMAVDIEHIRQNMDTYLMWDMLDLVRVSSLGGYHYYKNTLDNDFTRIKAIIGFGYVSGLIAESDFDNIYWLIVECQRRMQQEYKQYEEEHNGEFV